MPRRDAYRSAKTLSVILNVESGALIKLGPEKVEEGLLGVYKESNVKAQIRKVSGRGVRAALEAAREEDTDAVVVGGGDGTVATAATIFAGHKKPLGILPLGTFNLAARDVGMPLDWLEAARLMVTAPISGNGPDRCKRENFACAWWFWVSTLL